jgi:hypothetical protein
VALQTIGIMTELKKMVFLLDFIPVMIVDIRRKNNG